jgi:hypothetical protein
MIISTNKPIAAIRQLDVAIDLLFADYDPLAIRTLAAAAHGILSDLVEQKKPGKSWRSNMIEGSGLTDKAALEIINSAQNYLKHADRDPDAVLNFNDEENHHVLFFATLECGELGHKLSMRMQVFQIWYLASYPDFLGHETEHVKNSKEMFPSLDSLTREERLRHGAEFVQKLETDFPNRYGVLE